MKLLACPLSPCPVSTDQFKADRPRLDWGMGKFVEGDSWVRPIEQILICFMSRDSVAGVIILHEIPE